MPKDDTVISSHYQVHSADSYDNAYFYEPGAYMENLATLVRDRMKLSSGQDRCILDIGGGTGTFAQVLLEKDNSGSKIVVVEPFLEAAVEAASDSKEKVSFVKAPAEDFIVTPASDDWRTQFIDRHFGGYDQILLKEVVHHFQDEDRVPMFRGMREGLRTNTSVEPSLLIITRPKIDIDYPLWDEAFQVWKDNQPSIEEIEEDLRTAGYTNLTRFVEPIECSISLPRWQDMVKSRCWSTFSNFTDDELSEACDKIAETAQNNPKNTITNQDEIVLKFEDRLIFLEAS